MPMPCHMTLEGQNQGVIEGSSVIQGRENTILVYSLDHVIKMPRDTNTGLPTGKRIHMPMTVIKEIDKSSPKLYQALTSGEQFGDESKEGVILDFYRISPSGNEEKYFCVKLLKAIIVEVKAFFPETFFPDNEPYKHMEQISFTYEKIIWTWEPDGIEADDAWLAPK